MPERLSVDGNPAAELAIALASKKSFDASGYHPVATYPAAFQRIYFDRQLP
jgi:hypothetical protein